MIRYSGSKSKIIDKILLIVDEYRPSVVMDGFAGSVRVSKALKQSGYSVICNDINEWSYIFGQCFLLNKQPSQYYTEKINHLNNLQPIDGWYSNNYGGIDNNGSSIQFDSKKRMWQLHNTMLLDAIRDEIDIISDNEIEKSVLLTGLILALDKVDNTMGHQTSYLREWSPRSYKKLELQVPDFIIDNNKHQVYQDDIFDLLDRQQADLYYFDPPYGSNNDQTPTTRVRYTSYYHIWKTIILNDKPDVFGASNRRCDSRDKYSVSIFEEYKKVDGKFIAEQAIDNLIGKVASGVIVMSYNNNGRVPVELLKDKFDKCISFDHKSNTMTNMTTNKQWVNINHNTNQEYLFIKDKR